MAGARGLCPRRPGPELLGRRRPVQRRGDRPTPSAERAIPGRARTGHSQRTRLLHGQQRYAGLLLNGPAPAALVLANPDDSQPSAPWSPSMYSTSSCRCCASAVRLSPNWSVTPNAIASHRRQRLQLFTDAPDEDWRATPHRPQRRHPAASSSTLSAGDRAILAGEQAARRPGGHAAGAARGRTAGAPASCST